MSRAAGKTETGHMYRLPLGEGLVFGRVLLDLSNLGFVAQVERVRGARGAKVFVGKNLESVEVTATFVSLAVRVRSGERLEGRVALDAVLGAEVLGFVLGAVNIGNLHVEKRAKGDTGGGRPTMQCSPATASVPRHHVCA